MQKRKIVVKKSTTIKPEILKKADERSILRKYNAFKERATLCGETHKVKRLEKRGTIKYIIDDFNLISTVGVVQ